MKNGGIGLANVWSRQKLTKQTHDGRRRGTDGNSQFRFMTYRFQELGQPAGTYAIARGVNVKNNKEIFVVGKIMTGAQGWTACIWLPERASAPIILPPTFSMPADSVGFYKVAASGDAIGNYPFVINATNVAHPVADLQPGLGNDFDVMDINNSHDIVGFQAFAATPLGFVSAQGFLYNYQSHVVTPIPPAAFSGAQVAAQMTCPFGINAAGKVVGTSMGVRHNASCVFSGFLFSGNTIQELGNCMLYDINDRDLAVGLVPPPNQNLFTITTTLPLGFPQQSTPMWMDCSIATPTPHLIPLPAGYLGGVATAVNHEGIVVGSCWGSSSTAFLYKIGQSGPARDLNTLLAPAQPRWILNAAWDISDSGLIVGTASGGDNAQIITAGFLLKPNV